MEHRDSICEFNELLNWGASNPEDAAHEIRGLRMQLDFVTNGVLELSSKPGDISAMSRDSDIGSIFKRRR